MRRWLRILFYFLLLWFAVYCAGMKGFIKSVLNHLVSVGVLTVIYWFIS